MRMNGKVVIFLLCIVMVLSFNAIVVDAKITLSGLVIREKCDLSAVESGMDQIMTNVNANPQYTKFIEDSDYKTVKLVVDKTNDYYFQYNKDTKQVERVTSAQEDFTIKVKCRQINKVIEDYNSDSPKLNRAILNRVPQKIKSDILTQCFATPWCVNKLLGK
jgi:hypothetical protein